MYIFLFENKLNFWNCLICCILLYYDWHNYTMEFTTTSLYMDKKCIDCVFPPFCPLPASPWPPFQSLTLPPFFLNIVFYNSTLLSLFLKFCIRCFRLCECSVFMCESVPHAFLTLEEFRQGIRSPWTGVTDGYEPPCDFYELNLAPPEGQPGSQLLSHRSSPKAPLFKKYLFHFEAL